MGTKATLKRRLQRKRAKLRNNLEEWYYMDLEVQNLITTNTVSLGCMSTIRGINYNMCVLDDAVPCTPRKKGMFAERACPTKEEENSMNTERNYLERRVTAIGYDKERELFNTFNLAVDNTPRTYKDLIAAIKDGKYDLDPKRTKYIDAMIETGDNPLYFACGAFDGIIWKGEKMADRDGYDAAMKAMKKAKTTAMDIIQTQDAAAGLKALQDFEAWTPEGKAN